MQFKSNRLGNLLKEKSKKRDERCWGEMVGSHTSLLGRLASLEKGTTSRGREEPKLSARRSSGAEPIAPGNVNGKTPMDSEPRFAKVSLSLEPVEGVAPTTARTYSSIEGRVETTFDF